MCIIHIVKLAKWPFAKQVGHPCVQLLPRFAFSHFTSNVCWWQRKTTNAHLLTFCHYSYCAGRHAGGHLQPSEAGHRRTVWPLYLGPSKRKVMKTGFSVFFSTVSFLCPVPESVFSAPSTLARSPHGRQLCPFWHLVSPSCCIICIILCYYWFLAIFQNWRWMAWPAIKGLGRCKIVKFLNV